MRRIVLFVLLASAATLHAQINDSEVWVGSLDMSGGRFAVSNLTNISKHPGYDNQPAFFPDGKLVFTSQIAVLDETGHAVQAVIHDFANGTSTPIAGRARIQSDAGGRWLADAAARWARRPARCLGEGEPAHRDEGRRLLHALRRADLGALHERQAAAHRDLRPEDEGARHDGARLDHGAVPDSGQTRGEFRRRRAVSCARRGGCRRAAQARSCGNSISTTVTSPRSPRFRSQPRGATSGPRAARC